MELFGLLWLATTASFWPLLISSISACLFGLALALVEEHRLLPTNASRLIAIATLLFIFYPKSIVQSTIVLYLSIAVSSQFGQSIWGLVVANFPSQLATCYLIFALTIQVQSYSKPAALYLRNADGQPFPKAALISAHPFRSWIAAGIGIAYCSTGFQAAMIGTTGFVTSGSYLASRLRTPGLSPIAHLWLVTMAFLTLALSIAAVIALSYATLSIGVRAVKALGVVPRARRLVPHRTVVAAMLRAGVALVGALVLTLHVAIQLRLWGEGPLVARLFGRPSGSLEQTRPSIPHLPDLLNLLDAGLGGALLGAGFALLTWFSTMRGSQSQNSRRSGMIALICLAIVAFLPSSFPGVISLGYATAQTTQLMLIAWSVIAAGAFTALLVMQNPQSDFHYRYGNVTRSAGRRRAASLFFREYFWLLTSLVVLAVFANLTDDGFRTQVRLESLGQAFRNLNGQWSPDQRGLALMMLIFATAVTVILRRRSTSVNAREIAST
jgi:hypothetical protein